MQWVKLAASFYSDPAIAQAGEAAEVLFVRALAYAGDHETGGLIAKELLPRLTPTRYAARARALVDQGLWEVVPGVGWRISNWDKHQIDKESLEGKREAGRVRQQRHRDKKKSQRNAVTNAVSDAHVTQREVEEEVDTAAAAAVTREPPPLPEPVEILRRRLEASKLVVRWDRLSADQVATITALVDLHGDGPLVKHALAVYRPDRPIAFAQGWISGWQALPEPGTALRVVADPPCTEPGHAGTTRHCPQCASERLAGER